MLDAAEAVISTAARVAASLLAFTLWLPMVPAHAQVGSILQVTTTADVAAAADLNGSALVTVLDYNVLRTLLKQPPGSSALAPEN